MYIPILVVYIPIPVVYIPIPVVYIQSFMGRIFREDVATVWATTVAAAEEVLVCLPSDLSCYSCFGETLLIPSQVADVPAIHLCRYAVATFMAITCTNKSGLLW